MAKKNGGTNMLTEKDYCDYETCVALKELGYNRGAYAYYFPNHKEDLIFNTHPMRGCSINEMVKGYNTYPKDVMGHELIDAPTMWEAQKWLREEKKVIVVIVPYTYNIITKTSTWTCEVWLEDNLESQVHNFKTYEEALSEGIKEAVKILKENETIHE